MISFEGKTALITGASSGIGREFAMQLHALGANIVLLARRSDKLEQIAKDLLNSKSGVKVEVLVADLTDNNQIKKVEEYIYNNRVDILINNAGFGSFGEFDELSLSHELKMIDLNIIATVKLAHVAACQMKKRREGIIIALSSVAGLQPMPYMATYSATKAFNMWHSLALRQELSSYGIRVLTVCPGPTETEFFGAVKIGGSISGMKRDSVSSVVSQSLTALKKNKAYVVTGLRSKLMAFFSIMLPYSFTTWIMKCFFNNAANKVR